MPTQNDSIKAAKRGDAKAFTLLTKPHLPALRGLILRMVGHREDAEDLLQETLLRAFTKLGDLRDSASFRSWLFTIGSRCTLDHLRSRKRWREHAQVYARQVCDTSSSFQENLQAVIADSDFSYAIHEHIAFCFTCVGHSLDPEHQAAVLLREVFEFGNSEAAKILGLSESTFRHRLTAGRQHMKTVFEDMCSLINKKGVCYQCTALRDLMPKSKKGAMLETLPGNTTEERFRARLEIVRDAPVTQGVSSALHKLLYRRIYNNEEQNAA